MLLCELLSDTTEQAGAPKLAVYGYDWEGYDLPYDPSEVADQASDIASNVGIRISSDKDLSLVAMFGDQCVGAIYSSWSSDTEESDALQTEVYVFDFDVVADPSYRPRGLSRAALAGPALIDAALEMYNDLASSVDKSLIRVWVVNKRLAEFLENRYGFDVESTHGEHSVHMVKY